MSLQKLCRRTGRLREESHHTQKQRAKKWQEGTRHKSKTHVVGPPDKAQVNLADEESWIIPTSSGGFEQCYNAQASFDIGTMLIDGQHLTQKPIDKQEIKPALKALNKRPEELGVVDSLLAGTGYFSQNNVDSFLEEKLLQNISGGRDEQSHNSRERFPDTELLPEDVDTVTEKKHRQKKTLEQSMPNENALSNPSSVSLRPLWGSDSSRSVGWSPSAENEAWSAWLGAKRECMFWRNKQPKCHFLGSIRWHQS